MRRIVISILMLLALVAGGIGRSEAQFVSSTQAGDALIFPLWEVTNLNTLIAIESFANLTTLHLVRFRNDMGNNVL